MLGEFATADRCMSCKSKLWLFTIPYRLRLDPEPLNAIQEFEALMAGRPTYRAKPFIGSFWAIWRSYSEITFSSKADDIILASHVHRRKNPATDLPDYWPSSHAPIVLESNGRYPF